MTPILALQQIAKRYPGVVALDGVDLTLERGEVRALLGKNGAGKSTLIKILSGAVQPDHGTIAVDGRPVTIRTPHDAFAHGIATVYQELSLVPGLTVAENITLGRWPRRRRLGVTTIDRAAIAATARAALEQLEVRLRLDATVESLSVAQQQLVEIAKAISFDPRVLVLDEPTSALTGTEVSALHAVVRRLAAQGRGVMYVTHRMQEIPRIADSVTVLRDGRQIGTIPVSDATPARIAAMMIGADWQQTDASAGGERGAVRLAVRELRREPALRGVSFDLHAGEVLGIAGLLGAGRTELVRAIVGRDPVDHGTVAVNGSVIAHPNPRTMRRLGVGLIPEHRKRQGLVLGASVADNLTLAAWPRFSRRGVIQPGRARQLAASMAQALAVKTANLDVQVGTLSGGNQQKVVLGKWLNTEPTVLLLDEPTRGIDIQAKEQVFTQVRALAAQGLAVLVISSEIEEVLELADRILVMSQGQMISEYARGETDLEQLMTVLMNEAAHG